MASATRIMKVRIKMKRGKAGRKRKRDIAKKGSTPSHAALFDVAKAE